MAPSSFFDPINSPRRSPAATEAVAALEAIAADERAVGMAAYMRDQFEFFGIAATPRKEAVKEIIAKRSLDWDFVFALWAHPKRECQYVAVDHLRRQKLTIADLGQLQELVETKSWWDTVDHLAKCAGTALVPGSRGRGKEPNPLNDASSARALMLEWAEAENMWTRRIAILCQLSFGEKLIPNCCARSLNRISVWMRRTLQNFLLPKRLGGHCAILRDMTPSGCLTLSISTTQIARYHLQNSLKRKH